MKNNEISVNVIVHDDYITDKIDDILARVAEIIGKAGDSECNCSHTRLTA